MQSPNQTRAAAAGQAVSPTFRAYHAPQRHGEAFFEPALSQAPAMLERNVQTLSTHGDQWAELRQCARKQLIEDALRYTSAYRDVDWAKELIARQAGELPRIVMAGHQPTLFHPGVWFKNFALSRIGRQADCVAVNLVIDNDVAAGGSIRVPTAGDRLGKDGVSDIVYTSVPYDHAGGGVPFEQAIVGDREVFDHFDREVRHAILPLVPNPCVDQLWQHARKAIDRCGVAGCALAQARHGLEADVGLRTLELPMSVVCRGEAFARFIYSILSDLPRFHDSYNTSAQVYRRAHRIRSTAHPVPDLHQEAGDDGVAWYEAPLWVYGNASPTRKPVWASLKGETLTISDRGSWSLGIDISDPAAAIAQLMGAANPDCKLRPRALLTTMYARCVLSDLFLHGIGGGKYDQLGDMITRSFFHLQPTEFMVISATIQLPGIEMVDFDLEIRGVRRLIRETIFQPENFADRFRLDPNSLARKSELLSHVPPRGQRSQWHEELSQINRSLNAPLADLRSKFRRQLASLRSAKDSQSRISSREHSFCLFPLDYLVDTFGSLLDGVHRPSTRI